MRFFSLLNLNCSFNQQNCIIDQRLTGDFRAAWMFLLTLNRICKIRTVQTYTRCDFPPLLFLSHSWFVFLLLFICKFLVFLHFGVAYFYTRFSTSTSTTKFSFDWLVFFLYMFFFLLALHFLAARACVRFEFCSAFIGCFVYETHLHWIVCMDFVVGDDDD